MTMATNKGTTNPRTIAVSAFKARCLALLDDVATTGREIVVTKRGKPVARVIPADTPPSLQGSVTYPVTDDEILGPVESIWDVDHA